jgi:peroxiredoxin
MSKFQTVARILATTVLFSAVALPATAADRISDFSLIDHNGKFFQLSRHADQDAVVLFVHDDTRAVRKAIEDYDAVVAQFADQKVAFYMIDASADASRVELSKVASKNALTLPILMDDSQIVSEELGLTKASEVVVLDPKAKTVVYRGAINDALEEGSKARRASKPYLADALTAVLAGNEVAVASVPAKGDAIAFASDTAISYAKDIVPILEARCVTCHQEGGIAPFAMSNHQMVQGWSPMIREVLYTKRMPPGQIDKQYVNDFHDVNHITVAEAQTLVHWIDDGAKNTDGTDPLAEFSPVLQKWNYGEPDMVVKIPAQQIPATGVQDYRNLQVPLNLDKDVWVKAVEFVPGDTTVLHHIIAFAYGPNGVSEFEVLNQGIGLGAYAPGNAVNTYPENSGFPLKAGGGLLLQMHYTTSGKETEDASEIGLYLWDEPPARQVLGGSAADLEINVPPFSTKEMVATKKFRKDSYLTMLGPHMHYRGYDANFKLVYPDGKTEEILNVPNYQFNWQKVYDFKDPKFIPAGTEMVFTGSFDNTEMNPFNPDPSQTLSWGEQTWQEMFFGFFRYVEADGSD